MNHSFLAGIRFYSREGCCLRQLDCHAARNIIMLLAAFGGQPEDFVVEENGKAQKIATFAGPVQTASAPASLPPGIYSNRSQYRSTGGPVTVMLLDAINTPFSDQAYARRQMLSFVQDQYKPDQRMAVF